MKENMLFDLSQTLEVSKKGEFVETGTIEVEPPSMNSFDEIADFEQLFMGALISAGNLFKGKDELPDEEDQSALEQLKNNTPSAAEIRMLITVSQEIKIKDLFRAFKKVAIKTAKVAENLKMKDSHFDRLTRDDALRFMCEYASFFTFPSLLGDEQEEASGSETSAT